MKNKEKVTCIMTGGDYEGENPPVQLDVIAMLEEALKGAERGYIQELCIAITTIDGETHKDWAGDPSNWTKMYGQLFDLAAIYRECYSGDLGEED